MPVNIWGCALASARRSAPASRSDIPAMIANDMDLFILLLLHTVWRFRVTTNRLLFKPDFIYHFSIGRSESFQVDYYDISSEPVPEIKLRRFFLCLRGRTL